MVIFSSVRIMAREIISDPTSDSTDQNSPREPCGHLGEETSRSNIQSIQGSIKETLAGFARLPGVGHGGREAEHEVRESRGTS
jgi:hypothetical protein